MSTPTPTPKIDSSAKIDSSSNLTLRIYTQADEGYSLTVRNGEVVLAPANPTDLYQHWVKHLSPTSDDVGFPSFALVNEATGQAIRHPTGENLPVRLAPYDPDILDESVLWNHGDDHGRGFRAIRMVTNTALNLDAFHGAAGPVYDGSIVGVSGWLAANHQLWNIVHHAREPPANKHPTVRVYYKGSDDFSLAIRNGAVVFSPADPSDECQHWIKDMRYSTIVKDANGFLSFALVNKATGQALQHSAEPHPQVKLIPYDPDHLDESVLWSQGVDLGDRFGAIRMVNNISFNFDASQGTLVLNEWTHEREQLWQIVPYY